jgi:chloramphenicol 3-O-phosphotransferase
LCVQDQADALVRLEAVKVQLAGVQASAEEYARKLDVHKAEFEKLVQLMEVRSYLR